MIYADKQVSIGHYTNKKIVNAAELLTSLVKDKGNNHYQQISWKHQHHQKQRKGIYPYKKVYFMCPKSNIVYASMA